MSEDPGSAGSPPEGLPSSEQTSDMLRDTICWACYEDVYLVFHPVEGNQNKVEAICYNPQCPTRRTSLHEPRSAPRRQ